MTYITPYHAKFFAHFLTRRLPANNLDKLTASLHDAQVDLTPHQIDAALFAFKSPMSNGAILADEVGLGKQARLRGGIGGAMQTMRVLDFITDLATQMSEECPDAPLIICDSGSGGIQLARACECAQRFCGIRTLGLSGVTEATVRRFMNTLENLHISVTRRREMGDDIEGACGQLRRKTIMEKKQ